MKITVTFHPSFSLSCRDALEEQTRARLTALHACYAYESIEVCYETFHAQNPHMLVSAAADDTERITVRINTYEVNEPELLRHTIPQTLTHEFHHFIRWRYITQFHLAELMVLEGLANHFMMEILGCEKPRYLRPVPDEQLHALLPLIRAELFNANFDMRLWQRGDSSRGVPHAFGYSLGFVLVQRYFARHPGRVASNSFDLDCREVVRCLL